MARHFNLTKNHLSYFCIFCVLLFFNPIFATDWPRFHADSSNSGVTADEGPESDNVRWRYVNPDRGQFRGPTAVVEGKVYAVDDEGYVYCFDADNGDIIWETDVRGYFNNMCGICVDINNRHVYVANTSGKLYCFGMDANSNGYGDIIWHYDLGKQYPSTPVLNGSDVIIAADEWLFTLDQDGNLLWRFFADDTIRNSPAVHNGFLYIPSDHVEAFCIDLSDPLATYDSDEDGILDADSGEYEWKYEEYGGGSSPCVETYDSSSPTYLYISRNSGTLGVVRINITNATSESPPTSGDTVLYPTEGSSRVWGTPAVYGGNVFFGDNGGKVYHYPIGGEQSAVVYDTGTQVQCSPIVTTGNGTGPFVYFTANNSNMHCFKTYGDHDEVWIDDSHGFSHQTPAAVNGILYCGGSWHDLIAYGPSTSNTATTNAYCPSTGEVLNVDVSRSNDPNTYTTPHTFVGDVNEFTDVNSVDITIGPSPVGYEFVRWSTGDANTTLNVTNGGSYTAYYKLANMIDNDLDWIADANDNCPNMFNPNQSDLDNDGIGDACEGPSMDSNHDGTITLEDFFLFATHWLQTLPPECWTSSTFCYGDADGDGNIDQDDMEILIEARVGGFDVVYPDFQYNPCADFNQDGVVDPNDKDTMNTNFDTSPSPDCSMLNLWPPI